MKLYILTETFMIDGVFPDREIFGVFSTLEAAIAAYEPFKPNVSFTIEYQWERRDDGWDYGPDKAGPNTDSEYSFANIQECQLDVLLKKEGDW